MTWWEWKKKSWQAAAYTRHSAEGRQENSVENQLDAIRVHAERNNIEIVREFSDPGKSGLNVEGRKGFQALLEFVKTANIDYVICLDITRWGRFQNIDRSAFYEAECAKYGVKVIYVDHGDLKETDHNGTGSDETELFLGVRKSVERAMAGKFSRDISKKVFAGAVKVSEQGNRAGGPPPFGMLRLEVNEQREPVTVMKPKQHKSYPNNRVRLIPDPEYKAEAVRRIFDLFVTEDRSERQIATILDDENISPPRSARWHVSTIRRILRDEQYIGSVVYNKTSQRKVDYEFKAKRTNNPREQWVVTPGIYPQVITPAIFEAAQAKFDLRNKRMSPEEILERIRFAFQKYNMLSYSLMSTLPDMPTRSEVIKAFGSLPEAVQSLYPELLANARSDVRKMIESEANEVLEHEDFLVINKMFSVKIEPALPFPRGYGHQWHFRVDNRRNVDITLGVPLRDFKAGRILGYFPFPRVLTDEPLVCIADSSSFKIGLYGYPDLSFILDLIRWTNAITKEVL